MKKVDRPKTSRVHTLQAMIDYLGDSGMSDFQVNMLIHTNMPILGDDRNILNCTRDGQWDRAWDAIELYISGDMW